MWPPRGRAWELLLRRRCGRGGKPGVGIARRGPGHPLSTVASTGLEGRDEQSVPGACGGAAASCPLLRGPEQPCELAHGAPVRSGGRRAPPLLGHWALGPPRAGPPCGPGTRGVRDPGLGPRLRLVKDRLPPTPRLLQPFGPSWAQGAPLTPSQHRAPGGLRPPSLGRARWQTEAGGGVKSGKRAARGGAAVTSRWEATGAHAAVVRRGRRRAPGTLDPRKRELGRRAPWPDSRSLARCSGLRLAREGWRQARTRRGRI